MRTRRSREPLPCPMARLVLHLAQRWSFRLKLRWCVYLDLFSKLSLPFSSCSSYTLRNFSKHSGEVASQHMPGISTANHHADHHQYSFRSSSSSATVLINATWCHGQELGIRSARSTQWLGTGSWRGPPIASFPTSPSLKKAALKIWVRSNICIHLGMGPYL